jgi:hypothetical protein
LSYELQDGAWVRIDLQTDEVIEENILSFITTICESIGNDFVKCQLSAVYTDLVLSNTDDGILLSGLVTPPKVQAEDFVILKNYAGSYLTTVISKTDTTILFSDKGVNIRISGEPEMVGVFFVSFPPSFLDTTMSMMGYDLFQREDKEKRQERLGNYTFTNFDPNQYYGTDSYPANLISKVRYWQIISV